jgi:hypothetical protein
MKTKKFLYDPTVSSYDLFTDLHPNTSISIRYKTIDDVKKTIHLLEHLYKTKQYSHKRIVQVAMIMKIRLGLLDKPVQYRLAKKYLDFLKKRTTLKNRYQKTFKIKK